MKKWEEQHQNKAYAIRIKNAKPVLPFINKSAKLNKSLNESKQQLSQQKSPIQVTNFEN